MIAIGHLIGYAVGSVDLPMIFGPLLGDSQLKQVTVIAASALLGAVMVTSLAVEERVLVSSKDGDRKAGPFEKISKILKMTLHLPDRIQAICWVQFWAWIGWFPFLFYNATWVGEVYFRYTPNVNVADSADVLGDIGRVGSKALVVYSLVTFVASITLPWLVQSPDQERRGFTPRPPEALAPILTLVSEYKPDLTTAWMISHLMFAAAMCLAPFVRSLYMATVLVSICGV